MTEPLFRIDNLRLSLPDMTRKPLFGPAPRIEILKGLTFDIAAGSTIGIVGESGSGKSTLGRALVRLYEPTGGAIGFDGQDITHLSDAALRPLRRDLQVIFQDPFSSLNPRKSVGAIIAAPLLFHRVATSGADSRARVAAALGAVGLPRAFASRYPHELSGGQRQRVGIARAIALSPRFVLADEIVSGLDVSSQAQILDLLARLKDELKLTLAFISHDLSVVRRLCNRVIVMRGGEIVENRDTAALFDAPEHPYTRQLLAAIPLPEIDPGWLEAG
ncbi:ATP-binding cassette domain-containing protein [Methylocapsa sp. S129]|uniref:ATP-binding cassette domain-containing protein n=1 Tax=Methylocapsa sp. S129 TaxID=1641869 RepID=UPI00131E0FFE|nr:ATP-binding cassette domain-containing protein [Methylocapsa sp. S129]